MVFCQMDAFPSSKFSSISHSVLVYLRYLWRARSHVNGTHPFLAVFAHQFVGVGLGHGLIGYQGNKHPCCTAVVPDLKAPKQKTIK